MAGEYKRLLAWSENTGNTVAVRKQGSAFVVSASMTEPVEFESSFAEESLDDAAAKVIAELEQVGARSLEEIN
jgi:hypothetical protein